MNKYQDLPSGKTTVFISHANPEDNYFASWLGSKLKALGYRVWVDVRDIGGGDFFWQDFQNVIKTEAACFLAAISKTYIAKANKHDSGVMNEIQTARVVRDVERFMIPLRIDDCSYDDFPVGLIGKNTYDFTRNWADGLSSLLEELDKRRVPKNETNDVLAFWQAARRLSGSEINSTEQYYTNWFRIHTPEVLNIYKPNKLGLYTYIKGTTCVDLGNGYIGSFAHQTQISEDDSSSFVCSITVEDFAKHGWSTDKIKINASDARRTIVKLLNKILAKALRSRGLKTYEFSGKKLSYYYQDARPSFINLSVAGFPRGRRTLSGEHEGSQWNFAISYRARIEPFFHFAVTSHIIFFDQTGKPVDEATQHEHRRKLGSGWYNRKWLETLLAMMVRICGKNPEGLKADEKASPPVIISMLPEIIESPVGYLEPTKVEGNED